MLKRVEKMALQNKHSDWNDWGGEIDIIIIFSGEEKRINVTPVIKK